MKFGYKPYFFLDKLFLTVHKNDCRHLNLFILVYLFFPKLNISVVTGRIRIRIKRTRSKFTIYTPLKMLRLTSPCCQPVFLELLHLQSRGPVVHLQDPDKVRDRQHTHKP